MDSINTHHWMNSIFQEYQINVFLVMIFIMHSIIIFIIPFHWQGKFNTEILWPQKLRNFSHWCIDYLPAFNSILWHICLLLLHVWNNHFFFSFLASWLQWALECTHLLPFPSLFPPAAEFQQLTEGWKTSNVYLQLRFFPRQRPEVQLYQLHVNILSGGWVQVSKARS